MLETVDETFKIQVGNQNVIVSADPLKPAHLDDNLPIHVAQPPTRGRPKLKHQQPEDKQNKHVFSSESSYGRKRKQTIFYVQT